MREKQAEAPPPTPTPSRKEIHSVKEYFYPYIVQL